MSLSAVLSGIAIAVAVMALAVGAVEFAVFLIIVVAIVAIGWPADDDRRDARRRNRSTR